MRWFGHVERKNGNDWVSVCRNVVVAGVRCADRGRKTWYECVKDDMKVLGLHHEWAVFRDMWRGFILGRTSNPSKLSVEEMDVLKINDDDENDISAGPGCSCRFLESSKLRDVHAACRTQSPRLLTWTYDAAVGSEQHLLWTFDHRHWR